MNFQPVIPTHWPADDGIRSMHQAARQPNIIHKAQHNKYVGHNNASDTQQMVYEQNIASKYPCMSYAVDIKVRQPIRTYELYEDDVARLCRYFGNIQTLNLSEMRDLARVTFVDYHSANNIVNVLDNFQLPKGFGILQVSFVHQNNRATDVTTTRNNTERNLSAALNMRPPSGGRSNSSNSATRYGGWNKRDRIDDSTYDDRQTKAQRLEDSGKITCKATTLSSSSVISSTKPEEAVDALKHLATLLNRHACTLTNTASHHQSGMVNNNNNNNNKHSRTNNNNNNNQVSSNSGGTVLSFPSNNQNTNHLPSHQMRNDASSINCPIQLNSRTNVVGLHQDYNNNNNNNNNAIMRSGDPTALIHGTNQPILVTPYRNYDVNELVEDRNRGVASATAIESNIYAQHKLRYSSSDVVVSKSQNDATAQRSQLSGIYEDTNQNTNIMSNSTFNGNIRTHQPALVNRKNEYRTSKSNSAFDNSQNEDVGQQGSSKQNQISKSTNRENYVCRLELIDIFEHEPTFSVTEHILGDKSSNIHYILDRTNRAVDISLKGKPCNKSPIAERLHMIISTADAAAYRMALESAEDLLECVCTEFVFFCRSNKFPVPPTCGFRRHQYQGGADGNLLYLGSEERPQVWLQHLEKDVSRNVCISGNPPPPPPPPPPYSTPSGSADYRMDMRQPAKQPFDNNCVDQINRPYQLNTYSVTRDVVNERHDGRYSSSNRSRSKMNSVGNNNISSGRGGGRNDDFNNNHESNHNDTSSRQSIGSTWR